MGLFKAGSSSLILMPHSLGPVGVTGVMTLVKEITQDPAENSHILRTSERINFKKFSKESRPGNMLQKIAASNSTQVVSGLGSEMV